jgi:hypothetical protein
MIKTKRLSMIEGVLIFLVIALTLAAGTIIYAADTFYNGGAGATGVRELPLFVAKDLKIFDKYGLDVELISTDREKTPALSRPLFRDPRIGAWKRELIDKRQIELAEQALAKFLEIRDAVAFIRDPLSLGVGQHRLGASN